MRRAVERVGLAFTAYQVALAVREHWLSIPAAERARASELAMRSRLRPSSLSPAERAELKRLVAAMRLPLLGRRLAGVAFARRRAGRRR